MGESEVGDNIPSDVILKLVAWPPTAGLALFASQKWRTSNESVNGSYVITNSAWHGRGAALDRPAPDMHTIVETGVGSDEHTQVPPTTHEAARRQAWRVRPRSSAVQSPVLVRRGSGLATVDWASSLDTVAGCTLKRRATSAADFWPEPIIWMASWR